MQLQFQSLAGFYREFFPCTSNWAFLLARQFFGPVILVRSFIPFRSFFFVNFVLMCSLLHMGKVSLTLRSSGDHFECFGEWKRDILITLIHYCISGKTNISSPLHDPRAEAECRVLKLVSTWPIAKYCSTCSLKHSP